jgi:hypothetical protein
LCKNNDEIVTLTWPLCLVIAVSDTHSSLSGCSALRHA